VRLYTAKAPREHEGVGLTLGVLLNKALNTRPLPAGNEKVHVQGNCLSDCTNNFAGDVHVFGSYLHMHNYGKQIYTSLYDKAGKFKSVLNRIDFWNAGFQHGTEVTQTITPGDSLQTHCVYDTRKADSDVEFGESTSQEMCFDFLFVYPKKHVANVLMCGSGLHEKISVDGCMLEEGLSLERFGVAETFEGEGGFPLRGDLEGTFSEAMSKEQCSAKLTKSPTSSPPTEMPNGTPTKTPTGTPTKTPTGTPTKLPTKSRNEMPTAKPTKTPTSTSAGTLTPTLTKSPTGTPTGAPTAMLTKTAIDTSTENTTTVPTDTPTETMVLYAGSGLGVGLVLACLLHQCTRRSTSKRTQVLTNGKHHGKLSSIV
jgi:hypothetical protein